MAERNEPLFDAPIPGMSLTHELGARPWQNPPQYATVDDAVEFYLSRMATDEINDQIVDVLEMGVPVASLANTMQMANVMEGKHSVDVGILVMPVLMEMMMLIGDSAGVEYETGLDNPEKIKTRPSLVAKLKQKLQDEKDEKEEEPVEPETEEQDDEKEEPKGLMARR
tara:strand:+ start:228 stop:731 length:504 start_codon:yes stop_codon:yes gene_type:complete